jgi:hypothetical protein
VHLLESHLLCADEMRRAAEQKLKKFPQEFPF